MKVLYTANGFPPRENAGTEIYAYNLARELKGRSEINIFCRTIDRSVDEYAIKGETLDGMSVTRVVNNLSGATDSNRYFTDPEIDSLFENHINEISPDIVHVHHLLGLSGGMMGIIKKHNIPLAVTLHDYWFICPRFQLVDESGLLCGGPDGGARCARECPNSMFSLQADGIFSEGAKFILKYMPAGLQRKLKQMVREGILREPGSRKSGEAHLKKFGKRTEFLKEALLKADIIIAPSKYVRDTFIGNGFPHEKFKIIPHGIRLPGCKENRRGGAMRFGYLGSFAPLKGVSFLIEAFNMLGGNGDAELHIFGHGGENHEIIFSGLKKLSAKNDKIVFHGKYAFDDLGDIFAGLDVLIVPSLWPETFNIVMREAFACGVPVIAADAGALPEGVIDGINGLLFRTADAKDLAEKMRMVISNKGLLQEFRNNIGPVKDIAAHAEEMIAFYKEMLACYRGTYNRDGRI